MSPIQTHYLSRIQTFFFDLNCPLVVPIESLLKQSLDRPLTALPLVLHSHWMGRKHSYRSLLIGHNLQHA